MAQYRILAGMNYPPNNRAEIGDVVDDLDGKAIKWLLEGGYIEPADAKKVTKPVEEAPIETQTEGEDF